MSTLPKFSSVKPRPGQWCKLRVKDEHLNRLKGLGAWVTPDNCLVGIYVAPAQTAVIVVKNKEGKEERTGGEKLPGYIQVVDADGHDLHFPYKDKETKAQTSKPIRFILDHEAQEITDVHPVTDIKDIPPGRQVHPDFVPLP